MSVSLSLCNEHVPEINALIDWCTFTMLIGYNWLVIQKCNFSSITVVLQIN